MRIFRVNADKPHLWKADIAASVDQFNQWFMRFAPEAFRSTRVKSTERVKAALHAMRDLRGLDAAALKATPGALPTLRMCTAPPLAVDRLIGLANASKSLIGSMEEGRLAKRMAPELLSENLEAICSILNRLLDRDIFPWLDAGTEPTDYERDRASTIVADRLCSRAGVDMVRSARKQRQRSVIAVVLESLGFVDALGEGNGSLLRNVSRIYAFDVSLPMIMGRAAFLHTDACIFTRERFGDTGCLVIDQAIASCRYEAKRNVTASLKRRQAIEMNYQRRMRHALMLSGYYDAGHLGQLAAEGIDWVWQHRPAELGKVASLRT